MRFPAFLLSLILCISMLASGCTKSNPTSTTDTLKVHDTLVKYDTSIHLDTVHVGDALFRFISFLNNPSSISLSTTPNGLPICQANYQSSKLYYPLRSDTSLELYAQFDDPTPMTSSFTIPSTYPDALVTVALFDSPSGGQLTAIFAQDTAIQQVAPVGYGWLRLINGVSDYPEPTPQVNLFLDSLNAHPVFRDPITFVREDVRYQAIANYVLIPVGQHTVIVEGSQQSMIRNKSLNVTQGNYYTARFYGSQTQGTLDFTIDPE